MTESSRQYRKQWKQKLYVNCWYHSQYRSASMWAVYGESKASVAIRTTYGRLIDALPAANVFSTPSVGLIAYIDFTEDTGLDYRNVHGPFFQKDVSLLDEKEFRVMISDGTSPGEAKDEARLPSECTFVGESGLTCAIILENVIDRVFINPAAEAWFSGVVRDLMKDYCPTIILDMASLERKPRF